MSMLAAVPRADRGSGSLPVTLLLLVAATLAWWWANRALLTELRISAATARATLAREAADAGLGWAVAQLHAPARIDGACTPNPAASASFMDLLLPVDLTDPARPRRPGTAQPACVLHPAGWQCACPASGVGTPAAPAASDAAAPAFRVRLEAGPGTRQWWLHADGCSGPGTPCLPAGGRADAQRHLRLLLGLLAALPQPPYATVNAVGDVQLEGDVQIVNNTPGRAWTVATAARLTTSPTVRLMGRAGQPDLSTAIVADARGQTPDGQPPDPARWFALHFALSPAAYRELPHVHRLSCGASCGITDVTTALSQGHRVLWADGTLTLDSATTLGGPEDPILLIVNGTLRINAGVTVHGVLHAPGIVWDTATPALLRGALNSAGLVRLAGPVRLVRDEVVIARLSNAMGSLAPAPGSWGDAFD